MGKQIETLKHYVLELEHKIAEKDKDAIRNITRVICNLSKQIEVDFATIAEKDTGVYFKSINTIPFLYKPIQVSNPYEGNYLERFSRERTNQLVGAGAIAEHNKFWTDHNVESGNIFGSVPRELISEDAVFSLKRMGWQEVKVEVLDFGKRVTDLKQIYEFCSENFVKYIVINEETTKSMLALKFAV